jgi:hypothetical protein
MALGPVAMDTVLNVTWILDDSGATSDSLGYPCLIFDNATGDPYSIYTTSAAIDAAETAGTLTSAAADALRTAFEQLSPQPAGVVAIRYNSGSAGTPITGLEAAITAGLDVGGVVLASTAETDQETLAGWFAASDQRLARYLFFVQSTEAGLYGGSKPAALDACELQNCRMFYVSADTQYLAFAALSRVCGRPMVGTPSGSTQTDPGPAGAFVNIRGVALASGLDASEIANLTTNDVGFLQIRDYGSDSTEYDVMGSPNMYNGGDYASAVSLCYASRQVRAVLQDLWGDRVDAGRPIPANRDGIGLAKARVTPVLDEMAAAGHFTLDNPSYPGGYRVTGSIIEVAGLQRIQLAITLALPGGITGFTVPLTGVEA